MPRHVILNERWERRKECNATFDFLTFENTRFHKSEFDNCVFTRCHFKNAYLGFGVTYRRCTWQKSKFSGKYLTFGPDSLFENCIFDEVAIQSASMEGVSFTNCTFHGELKNMIIYGDHATPAKPTVFRECDMSAVRFSNVNFYGGVGFETVKLPSVGIRIFRNPEGRFSEALRNAVADLSPSDLAGLIVLGNMDCYGRQNPVVFGVDDLGDMLDSELSRTLFERTAKDYEIVQAVS
jgi:uncharacterized protein YjbI with pentapeptide repeats